MPPIKRKLFTVGDSHKLKKVFKRAKKVRRFAERMLDVFPKETKEYVCADDLVKSIDVFIGAYKENLID